MRKKLLALLMCATMVLGTAATAFAAVPSEDTYANAKKVFSQGSKFYAEANETEDSLKTTVRADKVTGKPSQTWQVVTNSLDSWKLYDGSFAVKIQPTKADGTVVAIDAAEDTTGTYTGADLLKVSDVPGGIADDQTVTDLKVYGITVEKSTDSTNFSANNPSVGADTLSGITAVNVQIGTTNYVGYMQAAVLSDGTKVFSTDSANKTTATQDLNVYLIDASGNTIAKITTANFKYNGAAVTAGTVINGVPEVKVTGAASPVTVSDTNITYSTGKSKGLAAFGSDGLYNITPSADDPTYVYVINAGKWNQEVLYADADGYLEANYDDNGTFKTNGNTSLGYAAQPKGFVADAKSVTRDGSSDVYFIKFSALGKDDYSNNELNTVAYALDDETISSNAVAVGYTIYKGTYTQSTNTSSSKVLKLTKVNSLSSNVTFKLSSDVLSRTKIADAGNVRVYAFNEDETITKDGLTVYGLALLGESAVDGTFTFSTRDFTENILIFDGFEDESQNDGVADDTTTATTAAPASQTAATSPKTGDVAPIAALAVVMMGACGAMVVASKKRA